MTEAAAWLVERIPRDEDIPKEAIAELATELGRERGLWEHLVRHDPGERVFIELYRDVHLDAWLICWDSGQDTGFHDHDLSSVGSYGRRERRERTAQALFVQLGQLATHEGLALGQGQSELGEGLCDALGRLTRRARPRVGLAHVLGAERAPI